MLQAMGLVESRVGDGTFARAAPPVLAVTDLATALRMAQGTLADQLELRRLLEPLVASLAAERATDGDIDELSHYLSLQEARLAERVPFVEEDSAFHLAVARATKNALLVKMVEGIHELLRDSREYSLRTPGGMHRSLAGHRRLSAAIGDHDSQAAYDAMTAHILDVERLSLQSVAEAEADGR